VTPCGTIVNKKRRSHLRARAVHGCLWRQRERERRAHQRCGGMVSRAASMVPLSRCCRALRAEPRPPDAWAEAVARALALLPCEADEPDLPLSPSPDDDDEPSVSRLNSNQSVRSRGMDWKRNLGECRSDCA